MISTLSSQPYEKKEATHREVFEWLGWSPAKGSAMAASVDLHFPNSIPGSALTSRVNSVLKSINVTPENSILGTSICSDEINSEDGDMADQFKTYYGQVFSMGGIGGAPFVGKTGFNAFAHHVPDGGNVLILYGPHIGVSSSGELGKYHRCGQKRESCACGALTAALDQIQRGQHGLEYFDCHDVQQSWLRDKLAPYQEEILAAPNSSAALARRAYHIITESIDQVVNTDFGSGKLILLGGIQINMFEPHDDHFLPLRFEILQRGQQPVDMMTHLKI